MADRFPSLDDFDAGQTEPQGESTLEGIDEPSDFLARERAALGDDAEQFGTSADELASAADAGAGDDDLLGGSAANDAFGDDIGEFESSFPTVETGNQAVGPGGTITGSAPSFQAPARNAHAEEEGESDAIREWRERRDLQLQHRDEVSESKKAETVKAAQQAIDEFYENYNNKRDKGVAQTRKEAEEFLKNREDTTSGGTSWERIAKLVDLSGKGAAGGASGSGKAKMRELLLSLRKDEKAPGASGY